MENKANSSVNRKEVDRKKKLIDKEIWKAIDKTMAKYGFRKEQK